MAEEIAGAGKTHPDRKLVKFKDGWKLFYTIYPSVVALPNHLRIMETMCNYMIKSKTHSIRELERVVMDSYEQEKFMSFKEMEAFRFKWTVIAKQHQTPFAERFSFSIYVGRSLLASVFEPAKFEGKVVIRRDYQPIVK